jgi:hypothetical protein
VGKGIGPHRRPTDRVERLANHVEDGLARKAQGVTVCQGMFAVDVVMTPPAGRQLEWLFSVLIPMLANERS